MFLCDNVMYIHTTRCETFMLVADISPSMWLTRLSMPARKITSACIRFKLWRCFEILSTEIKGNTDTC